MHKSLQAKSLTRFRRCGILLGLLWAAGCTTEDPVAPLATVQPGSLALVVQGLDAGVAASVTVTGPGGFSRTLTGTEVIGSLAPGTYTVSAMEIVAAGHTWAPAIPMQSVVIPVSASAYVTVSYAVATGAVTITIAGLPASISQADLTLVGPASSHSVTATTQLVGVTPGSYLLLGGDLIVGAEVWAPRLPEGPFLVPAGLTPVDVTVPYVRQAGTLEVSVTGLPAGVAAALSLETPGGDVVALEGSGVVGDLNPGMHTLLAGAVPYLGDTYTPSPLAQQVEVRSGETAVAQVAYASATGDLTITISGLPSGTPAQVTVTGPGGFSEAVTGTTAWAGLAPGTYAVTAVEVTGSGTYIPSPAIQNLTLAEGSTVIGTVSYSLLGGPTLNLRVEGVYLTQAAQRFDGATPLVAGRDAYLRAFATANEANVVAPRVRVRLYHGADLVQTYTLNAPGASVPLAVNEGTLSSSWNVPVPGALIQPGLRVLADVDPDGQVAEASEADNVFPENGTPGTVDVRALPLFRVRFVPVLQSVNDSLGNVTAGNMESYFVDSRRLLPVAASETDIRQVYVTNAPVLQSNNANGAWHTILNELLALRSAEGSDRYYYGVVRTGYTSGVAGLGYVGGGWNTAIGWDRTSSRSWVMAHEVGHNMARPHAPGCGAGSPDPLYPYPQGQIGIWGLDVGTLSLKPPSTFFDIMGYCASSFWVSDYNWNLMVGYRQGGSNNAPPAGAAAVVASRGRGLLVWGRLTRDGPVLEPAFVVDAPASLPAPGPYRVELVGIGGRALLTVPFQAAEVADHTLDPAEAFAFVLPLDAALEQQVAELRLTARGRTVVRRSAGVQPGPEARITRGAGGVAEVQWDADRYPMVLVRDQATGRILSFARNGRVVMPPASGTYRITVSDGVRSRDEVAILPR